MDMMKCVAARYHNLEDDDSICLDCEGCEEERDVVEVVRCKDCKYFEKWYKEVACDTGYYCTRANQQSCNLVPDDFCSYGERKDG